MKVQSYDAGKVGTAEFDSAPFGTRVLYRTLKDAVVMYHANQRQGTAKVKTRAEVHGSHAKPWKQKHTGRARAGDKKSPLWRKGGTIFGPHPRDFGYHMPKTARRVALRSALYGKLQDGELVLATLPRLDAPSAKSARKVLADLGAPRRALVLLSAPNANVWKSFRNFPGVVVRTAADLNARDVVNGGTIIAEPAAMTALAERVGTKTDGGAA
ncbi:MAG: 50S ribosomal protein L4 [Planctomycetes bacterium]|nr:50S ribosomal protein L4 [Planctomycetota bacterium]